MEKITHNIAYRFRIYPTREQEVLLAKTFGCCRFLYNQVLSDKIWEYEVSKKMLRNTPAMYKKAYPFLKEVDSLALANRNYYRQKKRVALCHEKIRNQRKDFLHKLSHEIAEAYDVVAVEDIDMKAMSQCMHFGKSVMDNGYGKFRELLEYKLTWRGKKLVRVDRFFPSSKKCCKCGHIKKELKLSDRVYLCTCGNRIDRDLNAAINIREEARRMLLAG